MSSQKVAISQETSSFDAFEEANSNHLRHKPSVAAKCKPFTHASKTLMDHMCMHRIVRDRVALQLPHVFQSENIKVTS